MKFNLKTLNKIGKSRLFKKKEDQLKFVIKKCIKHMQEQFRLRLEASDENFEIKYPNFKKNKDNYFYQFYFKEIAEKEEMPLENFFHFRTGSYRYTQDIPNSVTKKSINLWKKNPDFINQIIDFINTSFRDSFESFNIKKIRLLLSNWENTLEKMGEIDGMNKILKSLKSRGCKLPWTLSEVNCAIENTLSLLI